MVSRLGFCRATCLSFLAASFLYQEVSAQSTDATCILSSLGWSFNSHKESPCQVASSLIGVCYNTGYNVPSLPEQNHYLGPSIDDSNPCQCNTVVYSLMSACGLCQNRTIASWNEWSANCALVYTSYPEPIPSGTVVPGWAYLDVKSQGTFNAALAQQDANATESTAIPVPTSTSSSTSSTSSETSTTSSAAPTVISTADAALAADDRRNKIGGGIVGGVLGLFGLCALLIWLRRRRKTAQKNQLLPTVSEDSKEALPTIEISSVSYAHQSPSSV
ncbi:hypothetical protein K435DRAFT_973814 [Dendrothele bispora CBS 962.96]|uniref:Mid2 domain-containing protein n=1 Tax=Dendrothele bispora (strain CBS 962.96) TaxID=1314807 RepID=A0A4S8KQC9_DENBC|nr:hypothetical protein K435DRAFT_973814 [Dendrothele bispora CBS 962.96]